jgi:ribose 5-phosphate isomerase A
MLSELTPSDRAKQAAARRAVDFIEDGMRLGLGTGSTAAWMVQCLGERIAQQGLKVTGVPTSSRTAELAQKLGIPLVDLDDAGGLDLTIDGTDECDPMFNLIKGGGGALLREKMVAAASDRMIVIADAAKQVDILGTFPLPVEVIPFGWKTTRDLITTALADAHLGGQHISLRMNDDQAFRTDENNYILDLHLKQIDDAANLSLALNQIPGVVENGLFLDMCDMVIIGHGDGSANIKERHC